MRTVNLFFTDTSTTSFTFFYQSAHNADRSVTVADGAQSSTGPMAQASFVAIAAMKKRRR